MATTISIHHVNRRYVISEITLDSVEQNNSVLTQQRPTGNHQVFQERKINTQFRMETEIPVSNTDTHFIFPHSLQCRTITHGVNIGYHSFGSALHQDRRYLILRDVWIQTFIF